MLTDDTDAIVTSATVSKLNPTLHIITELLHGGHAPFLRPQGAGLNDAQRSAFIYILEEREAARQRARMDDLIRRIASEQADKALARFADAGMKLVKSTDRLSGWLQ